MAQEDGGMDGAQHALLLPFDTDEPEFARGFEVGALWARASSDPAELDAIVHATNTEMVMRLGSALGRQVVGEELDDNWTRIRILPDD